MGLRRCERAQRLLQVRADERSQPARVERVVGRASRAYSLTVGPSWSCLMVREASRRVRSHSAPSASKPQTAARRSSVAWMVTPRASAW